MPELIEQVRELSRTTEESTSSFPYKVLPSILQEVVSATHKNLGFPIDYIGPAILVAAGTAIGNTFAIKIQDGWIEATNIYVALVGDPGSKKTPPIKSAFAPIEQRDYRYYEEYKRQLVEYDRVSKLTNEQRNSEGITSMPTKPVCRQTIVSDFTQEALVAAHLQNARSLAVYADELMGFIDNANRYNNASKNDSFWLSCWSRQTIIVNRKGSDTIMIKNPFIPIIGGIQPALLKNLAGDNRADNGFTDRMLFAFPEDLVRTGYNRSHISPEIQKLYKDVIDRLLDIDLIIDDSGNASPRLVEMSPDAEKRFAAWSDMNDDLYNKSDNPGVKSIYAKLDTNLFRISLILQMLYHVTGEAEITNVEIRAIEGAIEIIEYFRSTALRVKFLSSNVNPLDFLNEQEKAFYNLLTNEFTTSQAIEAGGEVGISRKTVFNWLKKKTLYQALQQGQYKKK